MLRILPETPDDTFEVELLFDQCFAPGRTALSSYRLRDGAEPVHGLCRLVRDEYNAVIAAIRYWPVRVGADGHAALLLGPVAVHPTRQGEGLAALLIGGTLEDAVDAGWQRVILIGDVEHHTVHPKEALTKNHGFGSLPEEIRQQLVEKHRTLGEESRALFGPLT